MIKSTTPPINNVVKTALKYDLFGDKGRTSLIFETVASRCYTISKGDFVELVKNPVSEKLKSKVTGIKIKGKGIVKYSLKGDNGHVITLSTKE